jgi:deoxyribose-phosphate aldolase
MSFNIAPYIDHSILKQTTTLSDIDKLCVEASRENFAAVCIPPRFVADAKKMLDGTRIKVATVVSFPSGFNAIEAKVKEIDDAIKMHADELDMVINLSALKAGDWKYLEDEITECLKPVYNARKSIKVIIESGLLTENELVACCKLYGGHAIDYLKTSTGFADKGATVQAVQTMKANLPKQIGIKAAGGIRSYEFAKELIDAGATRIGCSASMQIMRESRKKNA